MKNPNVIPSICIVGKPNVGKSSLFNLLMGERRAVVVEQSGTTRDRIETLIRVNGVSTKLIDTGGYLSKNADVLHSEVKDQIYRAMEESSIILMVVDTVSGIAPLDEEVAYLLRKFSKPVILVSNKTDNDRLQDYTTEFYRLGFGEPEAISCLHRRGIRKLKKRISEVLLGVTAPEKKEKTRKEEEPHIKVAVIGKPNVGKSSFINNLLKSKRVIVSDIPGTTRDSIDTYFNYDDTTYTLIDTAGIRHRRKIKTAIDIYSIMRSKEAIKRADVVMLLLDAAEGVARDDLGILDIVEKNGKACILVVNKWDLAEDVDDVSQGEYKKHLEYAANCLNKFPLTFVSAKTGKNVLNTIVQAKVLNTNLDLDVSTPFLNKIFTRNDPSLISIPRKKKRPNFLYAIQSGKRPLGFKFFVNNPSLVLPVHLAFIENKLRENLPLSGIPVKIFIRKSRKEKK